MDHRGFGVVSVAGATDSPPDLKALLPAELAALLADWGEPAYRARQIHGWIHKRGALGFGEMTDLPAALRERLERECRLTNLALVTRQASARGDTEKFLFACGDGQTVESVLMRYGEEDEPGRCTVCISTQIGCAMACAFCASGLDGVVRNLTAGEIVDQVLCIQRHLGPDERVSNVVFMGLGEPFANYEATLQAIRLLNSPGGLHIGQRRMTVSTSGLVPAIKRFAGEDLQVRLAVSLHAATDDLRTRLMPINARWPVAALLAACKEYQDTTGRRVSIEYLILPGENDRPQDAAALAAVLRDLKCYLNLIPWNPVPEFPYPRCEAAAARRFQGLLEAQGLTAVIRREMGQDIDAACGQLRRRTRPAP